jgi:chemotaxis protein MotB
MQSEWKDFFFTEPGQGLPRRPGGSADLDGGHWSVPWADLMMVMFVLFVVLYIFAVRHKDVVVLFSDREVVGDVRVPVGELDSVINRAAHQVQDVNASSGSPQVFYKSAVNGVSVIREERRVRVTLRGGLFFESGSAQLQQEADAYLAEVAEVLRLTHGSVDVVGYADAGEASGVQSFRLTAERAANVVRWFAEQSGIATSRFSIVGRGGYVPELPSLSRGHADANRRVEVIIHTGV